MAGKIIDPISKTIAAVGAGGVIDVTTNTGLYKNAYGYLFAAGQPGMTIKILELVGLNGVRVMEVKDPRGNSIQTPPMSLTSGNTTGVDATAYVGGFLSLPSQLIYNPNDKPLD